MEGFVVDGRLIEGEQGVEDVGIGEVFGHAGLDVAVDVGAEVVGDGVAFVDEDFEVEVGFGGEEGGDVGVQALDGVHVFVLRVDEPDDGCAVGERGLQCGVAGVCWVERGMVGGQFEDVDIDERSERCC